MITLLMTALLCAPLQLAEDGEGAEAIVQRIRETQRLIDDTLIEAADADRGGFAALLAEVRLRHIDVIRDLEELIKQAKYSQSPQSNSGGGESDSESQGSPSPDASESSSRESDGSSAPEPSEQGAEAPEPGGTEGQEQPAGGAEQPAGGEPDDGAGSNEQAGGPPPPDPTKPVTRQDTDDRWGLLPPKLQERLMNLHVDDVPERYRSWLEAYVRSMHALEQRDGP